MKSPEQTPDDTSGVSPTDWYSHFSNLLAQKIDPVKKNQLDNYIFEHAGLFQTKLDDPFTVEEFDLALKDFKNNKASSFEAAQVETIVSISALQDSIAFCSLANSKSDLAYLNVALVLAILI